MCVLGHFGRVWLLQPRGLSPPGSSVRGKNSRQEHWSGLPCPPAGNLPDPGGKPSPLNSPALAGEFLTTRTTWEAPGRGHRGLLYQYYFLSENNDISGVDRSPEIGYLFSQETALVLRFYFTKIKYLPITSSSWYHFESWPNDQKASTQNGQFF